MKQNKLLLISLSIISSLLYAQSEDSDANEEVNALMEDIIVTANKRKEALSDVAASTNVISASVLEELDISVPEDGKIVGSESFSYKGLSYCKSLKILKVFLYL